MIAKIPSQTLAAILTGEPLNKEQLRILLDSIVDTTAVIESTGAPTIKANLHAWYFDTAANRYYRNVDGGTTWVALN